MQFISITGRTGGDAEIRSAGDTEVTSFNCAVDQGWGERKQTNWYRVSIWGSRGRALSGYIKKGEKVAVTGELVIGEYNGKPQYEIRAAEVDPFMSGKQSGGGGETSSRQQSAPTDMDLEDDVPFASCDPALEYRVR